MKKIRIFLASSAELDKDKELFEMFISKKNKEWYHKRVFLELLTWKDFIEAMSQTRLQDDYNKAIRQSDICVFLFHTRLGRFTSEEFNIAYDQFKKHNHPLIFTYFKDSKNAFIEPDIEAFKTKLDEMGHFYSQYLNDEDLNYKFDQQLDKLADIGKIRFTIIDLAKYTKYSLFFFILPAIFLFLLYEFIVLSRPFQMTVITRESRSIPDLPFEKGTITLNYKDKTETQTFVIEAMFKQLPASLRKYKANLIFEAPGYERIDTTIVLQEYITLLIRRDKSLAKIFGIVKDEQGQPIADVQISIRDIHVRTDSTGCFQVDIPLEKQAKEQRLAAFKKGFRLWDVTMPVIPDKGITIILVQG